ncbi:transcriptional regulatory protein fixJ [Azorhizobium caulinodans ORS 571]|uniref:Transcriptional regulatory protein FixJ n=1 Tax=Azorhizobium caulinodans (strain ATCC 43989 / DSM 5975 / JCM 20966 / LMG 6465 / NBRC 14845 / NCIMB 13405 / ORS 571) TaxID=438753 RepID=FIXJ_AZOC5|nr:response regulator FixJ [Azorhizobium caulinodans]P26487.1 RecName: Full=Transcriptional regulatory protein FixJ [Azorhizobium caulinodans ORS 571]BAF90653.1 transcriptional regulatory protein fixJ [Azorhizobium caulinodans ORS 571]CAA39980.1 fixJ [Azorhizobium caulinodans ORS 571]
MPESLPVHVIDDDDAVRESLAFLLESSGLAVTQHTSAAAFLDAGVPLDRGCIVTDVRMPGISGLELLKELNARGAHMAVIVMTGHGDVPLAVEAMKLGAADFLEKPFDDAAIIAAVRASLGRSAEQGRQEDARSEVGKRIAGLSQRERQVLECLVNGLANKTIAYDLGISPRTVEVYRANVMTKMKAASLPELVRMALLAGVAPADDATPT